MRRLRGDGAGEEQALPRTTPRIHLIAAAAAVAALALSVPVQAAAPGADLASASPAAEAAKKKAKKCRKGYRSVKVTKKIRGKKRTVRVCRRIARRPAAAPAPVGAPGPTTAPAPVPGAQLEDPNALARRIITGSQFDRPFATQYTSGSELWRTCADAKYFWRYTSSGQQTTSEYYGRGTWEFLEAKWIKGPQGEDILLAAIRITGTYNEKQVDGKLVLVWKKDNYSQTGISDDNGQTFKEFVRGAAPEAC